MRESLDGYRLYNKFVGWTPRDFWDLGRMAIYFQGAGEHWLVEEPGFKNVKNKHLGMPPF